MSETTNYGLFVSNDDQMTFREWRQKINGVTDSNMVKIDAAIAEKPGVMIPGCGEIFNDYENNSASGRNAHAEGEYTTASGTSSHAEGYNTVADGSDSHAEGSGSISNGYGSHAEGRDTIANGTYQHVQGMFNIADTGLAHIVGNGVSDGQRSNAHTISFGGDAWYAGNVYVGSTSGINKDEGSVKLVTEKELADTISNIEVSGGGGVGRVGSGENSTVFNNYDLNIASGGYSHAEGSGTTASGDYSHAEGYDTEASGQYSHAQGISTKATGKSENVIGEFNLYAETVYVQEYTVGSPPQSMYRPDDQLGIATGFDIHENGREFVLSGVEYRTAENVDIGDYVFYGDAQQVTTVHRVDEVWYDTAVYFVYTSFKLVNKSSDRGEYAHIVGNGISEDTRSNAHTLDWEGNAWFAGDVYIKSTSGKNRDNGSLRLVTTEDLAEVANASGSVVWGSF